MNKLEIVEFICYFKRYLAIIHDLNPLLRAHKSKLLKLEKTKYIILISSYIAQIRLKNEFKAIEICLRQ